MLFIKDCGKRRYHCVWRKKRRKKTEHTRMYAQLCSSANAIFTSVVVYSRTTKKTTNKKKPRVANEVALESFCCQAQ